MVVGTKMDSVIVSLDRNTMIQLKKEYFNDRPKQLPKETIQGDAEKAMMVLRLNDAETMNRQKLKKILSEPTPIMKECQKFIEERQRQMMLAKDAMVQSEFSFKNLRPEICKHEKRYECFDKTGVKYCDFKHYYRLILSTTKSMEMCNREKYSNYCQQSKCQYVHLALETDEVIPLLKNIYCSLQVKLDSVKHPKLIQWINCDLRTLDFSVLGKFDAIMMDPPWDIHMNLPYGTLLDKEMKSLNVRALQDSGVCFLWVTGRVLELGRDCLTEWGYKRVEELVWIKTNAQGKIVRTGRTGHWLNHSKEHCLIGVKGDESKIRRNIDCDVLVAEVRETSRKPDEIYSLIERMCPGGRKAELFARPHNRRPGWVSLGNQLPNIYVDSDILERFNKRYPLIGLTKEKMENFKLQESTKQDQFNDVYNNHLQSLMN